MYLVPYHFVNQKEIKFPKDYALQFKPFKEASDTLLAYGDTLILLRHLEGALREFFKKHKIKINSKTYPDNLEQYVKKLLVKKDISDKLKKELERFLIIRRRFLYGCFNEPHQSFMFYGEDMREQFNYLYYVFLSLENKIRKLI